MRSRGDGSTLNLDFTKMSALDSRFTYTRSTTATYINSSGYVASAAINEARFECDATTLAAKGLLIEGAATNLLNFSETFATTGGTNNNWADTNLTRTSTNNTSPRNDATALQITASAANGTIISSAAMGTSAARTLSVWLRRVTGTGNIQYTLDNGSTYTTQAITAVWVRYTFAVTTAAQRVGFRIVTSADAIEIWGVQLETGTGASSYIPTTTAQVTKAADFCKMTEAASQMSWLQRIDTCTFIADFMPMTQRGGFNSLFRLITTTSQGYEIYIYDTVAGVSLTTTTKITASTNVETSLAQSMALNSTHKVAYSINATSGLRSHNGSTVSAANPIALATGTNSTFGIGSTGLDAGAMYGHIRALKYYPTALTQAQINVLTT
jgi:hypothetical protein